MSNILVVGAGITGAVVARELAENSNYVVVIDKRNNVGGNCATEDVDGIMVHKYGPHIFHTSDEKVWRYVNRFAKFVSFINSPLAVVKRKVYNLPFNMNTFNEVWGISNPLVVEGRLQTIRTCAKEEPKNLEEKAVRMVGRKFFDMFIKGYTEKQWGRKCKDLPPDIIGRIPVRLSYNNNYFNDRYQGIPDDGYTRMIWKMLAMTNIQVYLKKDFFADEDFNIRHFDRIIFTGRIDDFFNETLGRLKYRSLRFEPEKLDFPNYQGNAVVNYCDREVPYTRIVEHKFFNLKKSNPAETIITKEYPAKYDGTNEPFYPVNDARSKKLYERYTHLQTDDDNKVIFAGRLGTYSYMNMDQAVSEALKLAGRLNDEGRERSDR